MNFTVVLSKDAAKKFSKLDSKIKRRIWERLQQLAEDPYNSRLGKPLVNALGRWSSRVGATWRIIYRIDLDQRRVMVDAIQPRGGGLSTAVNPGLSGTLPSLR